MRGFLLTNGVGRLDPLVVGVAATDDHGHEPAEAQAHLSIGEALRHQRRAHHARAGALESARPRQLGDRLDKHRVPVVPPLEGVRVGLRVAVVAAGLDEEPAPLGQIALELVVYVVQRGIRRGVVASRLPAAAAGPRDGASRPEDCLAQTDGAARERLHERHSPRGGAIRRC